jgi:hypothetical protein
MQLRPQHSASDMHASPWPLQLGEQYPFEHEYDLQPAPEGQASPESSENDRFPQTPPLHRPLQQAAGDEHALP